jgi:hypothetical protein
VRGISFGLRSARDGTVLDLGLAATDLILASHNRDECFALLFMCFGFDSAELGVLQGLKSSEVSPSAVYRFWPPHRPRRYCGRFRTSSRPYIGIAQPRRNFCGAVFVFVSSDCNSAEWRSEIELHGRVWCRTQKKEKGTLRSGACLSCLPNHQNHD